MSSKVTIAVVYRLWWIAGIGNESSSPAFWKKNQLSGENPPSRLYFTYCVTVMSSPDNADSSAIAVSVVAAEVLTAKVIGLVAERVMLPALFAEVANPSTLSIVSPPVLARLTSPLVVLRKAKELTAVSMASTLPIPVAARSARLVAVISVAARVM